MIYTFNIRGTLEAIEKHIYRKIYETGRLRIDDQAVGKILHWIVEYVGPCVVIVSIDKEHRCINIDIPDTEWEIIDPFVVNLDG